MLVPFTPTAPKSRLAGVMTTEERESFARAMLGDVLRVLQASGHEPTILTDTALDDPPVPQRIDDRSLSVAVNAALEPPIGVVMADLALLDSHAVDRVVGSPETVVIAPGRGGGTNMLVIRDSSFSVDYHGNSLEDHRRIAAAAELSMGEVDSFRLSTDIDEPDDLVEVILHGKGDTVTWLRDHGFRLATTAGRVRIERT